MEREGNNQTLIPITEAREIMEEAGYVMTRPTVVAKLSKAGVAKQFGGEGKWYVDKKLLLKLLKEMAESEKN